MSSTFIRDLSIDPRARQARAQQGLEESANARMVDNFRPFILQRTGTETGFTAAAEMNMAGGHIVVPTTGMYICIASGDTETNSAGAFLTLQLRVNNAVVSSGFNSTAGSNRQSIAMNWGGAIVAGVTVALWGEATAFCKCYTSNLTVVRVA
jgi:hypothetical protein